MWPFNEIAESAAWQGTLTVPVWAVGLTAASLLALALAAALRARSLGVLLLVVLIAGLGGWGVWGWVNHLRLEERQALQARLSAIQAHSVALPSALACLDGPFGDAIEQSCERALFASVETTAAALSLTANRIAFLSDISAPAQRDQTARDGAVEALRRALEQDPFGLTAQVFAVRYGCTPERCEGLAVLPEPGRVRTNLRDRRFESVAARYSPGWAAKASAAAEPAGAAGRGAPPAAYTLPSANSVPPITLPGAEAPAGAAVAGFPPADTAPAAPAVAPKPPPPRPVRPPSPPKPPQARAPAGTPGASPASPSGGSPAAAPAAQ